MTDNWNNNSFLSGGSNSSTTDLSDGTAVLDISSIKIQNLQPNKPIKTDSNKKLVSTLLNISDIANLQDSLDDIETSADVKTKLDFVSTSTPATPLTGRISLYAKTDGLYTLDDQGVEEELGAGLLGPTGPTGPTGPVSTVPGPTGPVSTVPGPTGPLGPTGPVNTDSVLRSGDTMTGDLSLGGNNLNSILVSEYDPSLTTPSNPVTGKIKLYAKTDGNLYKLNDQGTEEELDIVSSDIEVTDISPIRYFSKDASSQGNEKTILQINEYDGKIDVNTPLSCSLRPYTTEAQWVANPFNPSIPTETITSSLSRTNNKIEFNRYTETISSRKIRYYTTQCFKYGENFSFKFKVTGVTASDSFYIGLLNDLNCELRCITGQSADNGTYENGVSKFPRNTLWLNGDECEFRVVNNEWTINSPTIFPDWRYNIPQSTEPYSICVVYDTLNSATSAVTFEITSIEKNFPAYGIPEKQITLQGGVGFKDVGASSDNVIWKDPKNNLIYTEIEPTGGYTNYPIAGREVKVVKKFDPKIGTSNSTIVDLYEDDYVKFIWSYTDKQPSFTLKTLPVVTGWVTSSITFVGGGSASGNNGEATNALNEKRWFYGKKVDPDAVDPDASIKLGSYDHINYASTSTCMLCAGADINYPVYKLTLMTGNVASVGVAITERF